METQLTPEQETRIVDCLQSAGYAKPTDIRLIDNRILVYKSNCDRRDADAGAWEHLRHILAVDFDGDRTTTEIGVKGQMPDTEVVIVVKPEIFK